MTLSEQVRLSSGYGPRTVVALLLEVYEDEDENDAGAPRAARRPPQCPGCNCAHNTERAFQNWGFAPNAVNGSRARGTAKVGLLTIIWPCPGKPTGDS